MIQLKMGRGLGQAFFQRRHRDGQVIHDKMLGVTNHWRHASQNRSEVPPRVFYNGGFPKDKGKCRQGCGET